jgi:hypothetical protein
MSGTDFKWDGFLKERQAAARYRDRVLKGEDLNMGYISLIAPCGGCGRIFTRNPNLVPVAVVDGERIPFCRACVEAANPGRIKRGLEPIVIQPGAYEPAAEYCDDEPFDF